MWDTSTIIAVTGAASAAIGGAATFAVTKGVDAWLRIRKAKADENMDAKKYEDSKEAVAFQQATAAYEKLVAAFESRVKTLEGAVTNLNSELKESRAAHQAELKAARAEHVNCMVEQERLRGDLKALQVHVDRLWKHDQANKEQIEVTKAATEQILAAKANSDSGEFPTIPDAHGGT